MKNSLALVMASGLLGLENVAGLSLRPFAEVTKDRTNARSYSEVKWEAMTQADIDRLTEAHEKRERRKAKRASK